LGVLEVAGDAAIAVGVVKVLDAIATVVMIGTQLIWLCSR